VGCLKVDRRRISTRHSVPVRQRRHRAGQTILLVEDEEFVRKVTSEVLRASGFHVLAVANARDAVSIFNKHKDQVQLVMTDLVMPGKSGRILAKELRELAPRLSIILTSGYPDTEIMQEKSSTEPLYYLPKPYSVDLLILKVRQALVKKSETQPK